MQADQRAARNCFLLFCAYMVELSWRHSLELLNGPPEWERGQAAYDDGSIRLEHRESYRPFDEDIGAFLFELAGVETPADAVILAARFGLLRIGPGSPTAREPFAVWQQAANDLSRILRLYVLMREAEDDQPAADQLCRHLHMLRQLVSEDERRFLNRYDSRRQASIVIAQAVNHGLEGASERLVSAASIEQDQDGHVVRGEPDHFFFAPELTNLESLAYHQLALTLADGSDVFICARCGRPRPRTHGNQRHCNTRCRNQKNINAYRQRQAVNRSK
jgi:hypothetical protein